MKCQRKNNYQIFFGKIINIIYIYILIVMNFEETVFFGLTLK